VVFFFQAEDGIRDATVTGVQTCALPIWIDLPEWPAADFFLGRFRSRAAQEGRSEVSADINQRARGRGSGALRGDSQRRLGGQYSVGAWRGRAARCQRDASLQPVEISPSHKTRNPDRPRSHRSYSISTSRRSLMPIPGVRVTSRRARGYPPTN